MLPFHEPPPPAGQYNLLEKPFSGFLGSTSSSSPWFPFSPHEEGLHQLLFSPPPNYTDHPQPPPDPPANNNKAVVAAINGGATTSTSRPRRSRSLRKDRHSKIFTAQGPRDRRMRLSLEVARSFFDLQDMLAFDKPSKTVQWLLNQAKSAIKEVESISRPNCQQFSCSSNSNSTSSSSKSTESSTYESEDVSTISEPKGKLLITKTANEEKVREKEKEKAPKTKRSAVIHLVRRASTVDPALVRESRAKARARARERTIEKKKKKMIRSSNEMLGAPILSAATDQALEESVSDHELNSSLELVADVDEPCSHTHSTVSERVYGFLAISDQPGHVQDLDVSFLHEQWGMHYNTTTDEQVHAKQWFFNNNGSNLFL